MGTRKCPNLKILSIVVTLRIIKNRRREKSLCLLLFCLAGTPLPGSFWELLLEFLGRGRAVCAGWAGQLSCACSSQILGCTQNLSSTMPMSALSTCSASNPPYLLLRNCDRNSPVFSACVLAFEAPALLPQQP